MDLGQAIFNQAKTINQAAKFAVENEETARQEYINQCQEEEDAERRERE